MHFSTRTSTIRLITSRRPGIDLAFYLFTSCTFIFFQLIFIACILSDREVVWTIVATGIRRIGRVGLGQNEFCGGIVAENVGGVQYEDTLRRRKDLYITQH